MKMISIGMRKSKSTHSLELSVFTLSYGVSLAYLIVEEYHWYVAHSFSLNRNRVGPPPIWSSWSRLSFLGSYVDHIWALLTFP